MVSQVETFQSAYGGKPDAAPWGADNAVFGFWIGINEFVPCFLFLVSG